VSGHNPNLVIGTLEGQRVAVFGGRAHYYERAIRRRCGCRSKCCRGWAPIRDRDQRRRVDGPRHADRVDHVPDRPHQFLGAEPADRRADRPAVRADEDAYDPGLRAQLLAAAKATGTEMYQGVYAWYSGPSFETPAEIRAIRMLGADAVGMSTVPEVILGRFLGLRCAAISAITNMAAGMSDEAISHEHTKAMAPIGAAKLQPC
jgi:purine-nucleoside phosphorylase